MCGVALSHIFKFSGFSVDCANWHMQVLATSFSMIFLQDAMPTFEAKYGVFFVGQPCLTDAHFVLFG